MTEIKNKFSKVICTGKVVLGYGKDFMRVFLNMRRFTDHDMVHILSSKQALIRFESTLTEEEIKEVEDLKSRIKDDSNARLKYFMKYGVSK